VKSIPTVNGIVILSNTEYLSGIWAKVLRKDIKKDTNNILTLMYKRYFKTASMSTGKEVIQ